MPIRKNDKVAQRRANASELFTQGKTLTEIAKIHNVTIAQISYDLKYMFEQWRKKYEYYIGEAILIELEKLNTLEKMAWNNLQNLAEIEPNEKTSDAIIKTMTFIQTCIDRRMKWFGIKSDDKATDNKLYINVVDKQAEKNLNALMQDITQNITQDITQNDSDN